MIWDTFLFYNELDILECRLTELQNVVDKFVLVEAPVTFQGRPKPLYYAENKERFAPWADKIVHVIADNLPDGGVGDRTHAFYREGYQRGNIRKALVDANLNDIVLLSDVDEIPNANVIHPRMWTGIALGMSMHMFAVDWLHPEIWPATVIQVLGAINNFQALREMKCGWPRMDNAGHHFTSLGGADAIRAKMDAYSHVELRDGMLQHLGEGSLYERGLAFGIWSADKIEVQQTPIEVDDSFPRWIRDGKCPKTWFRPRDK
jgi:beta-1,4-mannosyl-glycoprotein beta-1,4-N-acetylglucosaminyltransferase